MMDFSAGAFLSLGIGCKAAERVQAIEREFIPQFETIEQTKLINQAKVIAAFRKSRVEYRHFAGTTGYGYGDIGRDLLDRVFADVFHTEAALVRPQIVSGTHALSLCLYALLGHGSRLISVTGKPYDTLLETIGMEKGTNGIDSLIDLGADYIPIELTNGRINLDQTVTTLLESNQPTIAYLQRSRGYDWRPAIMIEEIGNTVQAIKAANPSAIIVVDNCYGEFVEELEPTDVGADIIIGSLIKNPGGGLAPTGAYIAGKATLIDRIQYRLTAPGIGAEVGSWPAGYLPYYQGLFLAPHVVGESLKGATLLSAVMGDFGFDVMPTPDAMRSDITQSIRFGSEEKLLQFCRIVQSASPVDSHVIPEPWPMPGYQNDVVMAAGTFIQGASIELSADAPIKPPYVGYWQGGLTYEHCKLATMMLTTEFMK